jgi:hypothetical protein
MQRPVSVTVFGILNIVFAGLGLCGTLLGGLFLAAKPGPAQNPMVRIMEGDPFYATWVKISIPLSLLGCGALLAAGIGLLLLKEWGRKLTLGYAVYAIALGLVNLVIHFVFVVRPLMEEAGRQQGPEAFAAIGGAVGGILGGCLGFVYQFLLLYFMTRPNVIAAFRGPAGPSELPPAW